MNRSMNHMNDAPGSLRTSISHLKEEYSAWQSLLDEQPRLIEHFIAAQASALAEAITSGAPRVQFAFPAEVVVELLPDGRGEIGYVPDGAREHVVGGILEQITGGRVGAAVRQRLVELEQSPERAVAVCAGLLRFATATHMLHHMLPAGRSVNYTAEEGEDIPSIPVVPEYETASALTAGGDAIAEEGPRGDGRGELLVPFVPAARRFYLPQWVAFDDDGRLLAELKELEVAFSHSDGYPPEEMWQ